MGYRSQVAGVISVDRPDDAEGCYEDKGARLISMIKLSDFYTHMMPDYPDAVGWDTKLGVFMFHGDNWKWYAEYDVVKAWYELWKNMQQLEGVSGYFARVGENLKDIEEEEFGDDPCYDFFTPSSQLNVEAKLLGKRG